MRNDILMGEKLHEKIVHMYYFYRDISLLSKQIPLNQQTKILSKKQKKRLQARLDQEKGGHSYSESYSFAPCNPMHSLELDCSDPAEMMGASRLFESKQKHLKGKNNPFKQ